MQILRTGDLVRVRQARWRIVDVRPYGRCSIVTLRSAAPLNGRVEQRIVAPFDIIEPVERRRTPRFVRNRVWRRVCRALIARVSPPASLRSARRAAIDLLPHQLEPALAIVRGLATRVLLADEVGLGKTIEAGLVAAELLQRNACDRALVLTPAGLRDQWQRELADRFSIAAQAVDGPLLRRVASNLPIGMNPWQTIPIAVASVDYVKRSEVLPAVTDCIWDLLIVDEAHNVSGDSDRYAAVHTLATAASYVLLLTATPHNGDEHAFTQLCGIGAVDAMPLAVFRRTRTDVGIGVRRRVHLLRVEARANDLRVHALLDAYRDAVRAELARDTRTDPLLALSVLYKRAFSSAWSLAQSVERRLTAIVTADRGDDARQIVLPFDDPTGDLVRDDEAPPWPNELRLADVTHERRLLTALLAAARGAAEGDPKLVRLNKLLERVGEPAIVFTEYRDTLAHMARRLKRATLVLHGGLTRGQRQSALEAFAVSPKSVLLATDAAAEGLNLHEHCRLVVNLELPWNFIRLEQRIGRVDRIGQRRAVHAFNLIAAGTGELLLADRLRRRLETADAAVGAPNPLDGDERAIARVVLQGVEPDGAPDDGPAL